jgi:hypothetical protein
MIVSKHGKFTFNMTLNAGKLMLRSVLAPNRHSVRFVTLALACALFSAHASTINVPGASDIWLAGQPNGSTINDPQGPDFDTAPTNSPVEIDFAQGGAFDFSVTGTTTNWSGCAGESSADGGNCGADASIYGTDAINGISGYKGPINALIGVFTTGAQPTGPGAPATLDFTTAGSTGQSFLQLSPVLNQIFFIGDGLTGTGSGLTQLFSIPIGATRLFLASSDAEGGSNNNGGSFAVTYQALPEPASFLLLGSALAFLTIRRRFSR